MGPALVHEPPPTELARGRVDTTPEVVLAIAAASVVSLLAYAWIVVRRRKRAREEHHGPASSKRASIRPPKPSR
jgi:hypothetical protein